MKKLTGLLSAAILGSIAVSFKLCAAVGGYPVVLVHGLQPNQLASRPDASEVSSDGAAYWQAYWRDRADVRIDWPAHERVAGKIASDYVWPKLQQMSRNGTCANGCIFVSHSTGDLVTRYLIDNQALWLQNAGLIDFTLRLALAAWLGEIPNANTVGVLNDLRVNSARQLAAFPDSRVPRLRFVGAGSDYLGATGAFLPGEDDGVVASHSACGASTASSFNSCSRSIAFDGKLASQSYGVRNFMPYHYPLLMSEGYSHGGLIENRVQDEVTAASSSATYTNNDRLQFNTYDETRGWWIFSSRYRVVRNSDNTSMSALVFQAAN